MPGVTITWLSDLPGLMEPQLFVLSEGAASAGVYEHTGEEWLMVVLGELRITVSGETHVLTAGETLHFESHRPHSWANLAAGETRIVWVTTERGIWAKRSPKRSPKEERLDDASEPR